MSQLDVILQGISKKYGDIVETGIEKNDYDRIPFSSPRLNYMSFGGLPVGHIHEFSGPEGSGKTTTAFDIIKNAQAKFLQDSIDKDVPEKKILFVDVEGTFDYTWANKFGVDTTKIIRIKAAGWAAADVLNMMLETISTGEIGLAVLDSVAAMVPDQLVDRGVGEKIYGGIAQSLQNFCNQVKRYLVEHNATIICINQVRDNLNSMFGGTITPRRKRF